jgi:transcriptional regulator with XRE-family HTH domain
VSVAFARTQGVLRKSDEYERVTARRVAVSESDRRLVAEPASGAIMQKNQALLDRFGATVKSLREERGFTQEELAERSGMTEKHLGEIERGVTEASITAIAGLARGLQVGLGDLVPDTQRTMPEPPRLSRAQWQAVYQATLELNDAAKHMLGFADKVRREPPARAPRNGGTKKNGGRRG